ncbi:Crotonobetainyl-CoA:carnitine CoA-transferase CaiB [Polaromonas sp. OV174]|uniref:CaiB/BaiF CoA transferase family protein n=1 Tax=Polaromonas sp. OV174 TaxID=1855300 RepID=UPI0008E3AAF2|nr:CoA transferase [Polaromonas sp. OV174]SFB90014.1 Crotonobetainyl-CoA:carnitine CoA-transferase CaiB [Polaromonas sp. OV174]
MNAPITVAPYQGLKVLDLSQGVAGPYCAMLLLKSGAEVIKVEPPSGDWSRGLGYAPEGMSAPAISANLGKRSICIDAQNERGRELIRTLAAQADIVIESFRPRVMKRLGLTYADLSKDKPNLIYVSVTAFGSDGPYAERPGTDSAIQAMSGMMEVNRDRNGNPRKVGILVVDIAAGIYTAQAIGAALYRRATQGVGAYVEISLLEVAAAVQSGAIVDETIRDGRVVQPLSLPSGTFATRDGHLIVTALHDRMFADLCKTIKKEEWITDARFATVAARFESADEINTTLEKILREEPTSYWLEALGKSGVLCGKVSGYADFINDPQVKQQKLFQQVHHDGLGQVPVPRTPGSLDCVERPAPRKGEHGREILAELGLSAGKIQELVDAGVVLASVA